MMKLLRAGYRRYFRNILFWIALAASAILGALCGVRVKEDTRLDDMYIVVGFMIFAALIALMIGREFSDGGFRNKITSGHTKGKVFFSEYILALTICLILACVATGAFAILNASAYGNIMTELLVKSIIGYVFLVASIVTMIFVVSILLSKKAISAVIALLLVLGLYLEAYQIDFELSRPEFQKEMVQREDGMWELTGGTEKNPDYIDSPMRENLTFIVNIIPIGQAIQYNEWVVPLFDPINVRILMGEEEKLLNTMPFYSIGTTIVLLAGAYVIFRKKDFK
ncbi:MAG: ABC transporter permease subunit [Ruminococcus sp.]|nr:ABC transporter permease subunit [Ruminococcus sp.]MDD7594842.1 ABC transporter permease subunit [Clostridiales bacterium]